MSAAAAATFLTTAKKKLNVKKKKYSHICVISATSPLRQTSDINKSIRMNNGTSSRYLYYAAACVAGVILYNLILIFSIQNLFPRTIPTYNSHVQFPCIVSTCNNSSITSGDTDLPILPP